MISAEIKPLRTSPPNKNNANNAKSVVTEVLIVLDKVSFTETFNTSRSWDLLFFLRFSLTLSKTTTVSFNEYPTMVSKALLTIVGYSLNDTVVVFDRVRENLKKNSKSQLREVLNVSVNETLSRTIRTSVTTLLALLALFLFGGEVLRGFISALIIGVIIGSYSSVFIASRILLTLGVKRDWSNVGSKAGTQFSNIDA